MSFNEMPWLFTSPFYHTTGTEAKSADDNLRTEKKQVVKKHFLSDRFVLPFFRKESPGGLLLIHVVFTKVTLFSKQ